MIKLIIVFLVLTISVYGCSVSQDKQNLKNDIMNEKQTTKETTKEQLETDEIKEIRGTLSYISDYYNDYEAFYEGAEGEYINTLLIFEITVGDDIYNKSKYIAFFCGKDYDIDFSKNLMIGEEAVIEYVGEPYQNKDIVEKYGEQECLILDNVLSVKFTEEEQ